MIKKIIIYFLLILILISSVFALGTTPANKILNYNLEKQNHQFTITNPKLESGVLDVEVSGELSKYISVVDKIEITNKEKIEVPYSLEITEKLEEGIKKGQISIIQSSNSETTIASNVKINFDIEVFVPKKGKHIDTEIYYQEQKNEPTFLVFINNRGTQDIDDLYTEVLIKDNNEIITSLESKNLENFKSQTNYQFVIKWLPAQEGNYSAEIITHYDNKEKINYLDFTSGKNSININSMQINSDKILINLENLKQKAIQDIYVEVKFQDKDKKTFEIIKTDSILLKPLSKATFSEDISLEKNAQFIDVTIKQKDQENYILFNKTFSKKDSLFNLIIILAILLVVFLLVLFFILRKRHRLI